MSKRRIPQRRSRRPDVEVLVEVEQPGYRVVFTGLVHVEAGEPIGRLCVCTSDEMCQDVFFIEMEGTEAICAKCDEPHPIVDFKTAVSEGRFDLMEAVFCVGLRDLIGNLLRGIDPAPGRSVILKAATS